MCNPTTIRIAFALGIAFGIGSLIAQGQTSPPAVPVTTLPAQGPRGNPDGTVSASHNTGGFSAQAPSPSEIDLAWNLVPGAQYYSIYRSAKPNVLVAMQGLLVPGCDVNHWADNDVVPDTRYYYVIAAILGGKTAVVVATGSGATLAENAPGNGDVGASTRP